MSHELEFNGKNVLVVGGSSGIGNAVARAFLTKGAVVHVWGTRAHAHEYAGSGDSDLTGLHYKQVDVSFPDQIQNCESGFDRLDALVLSQGIVLYDRAEFEPKRFREVVEVNLNSLMECCTRFHPMLKVSGGSIIIISSTAALHSTRGNPAYGASKTGGVGPRRHPGQWYRAGHDSDQDDQGHHEQSETRRGLEGADSTRAAGKDDRDRRCCAVSRITARFLRDWADDPCRWRVDPPLALKIFGGN